MIKVYIEDKEYQDIDFTMEPLKIGNYENCVFNNCNFSSCKLSEIVFTDCEFEDCELSMIEIDKTAFRNINFKTSKLFGIQFENVNDLMLSMNFNNCQLNFSSFNKLNLRSTNFKNCNLQEVDFSETDLTKSIFDNCDLSGVTFEYTILEEVDFRTSRNYIIDPETNRIRKATFSIDGIAGLLSKYDIEIE